MDALRALRACGTNVSLVALRALDALRTLIARVALRALGSREASGSVGSCLAVADLADAVLGIDERYWFHLSAVCLPCPLDLARGSGSSTDFGVTGSVDGGAPWLWRAEKVLPKRARRRK